MARGVGKMKVGDKVKLIKTQTAEMLLGGSPETIMILIGDVGTVTWVSFNRDLIDVDWAEAGRIWSVWPHEVKVISDA
jgi:hypothetical protein